MIRYAILAAILLSACGQGSNNNGFGYDYDTEHAGLHVRYADTTAAEPSADHLYAIFADALKCADRYGPVERKGISVNPPLVIIVTTGTNDPFDGLTY